MADKADIVVYKDSSIVAALTLKPHASSSDDKGMRSEVWIENDSAKAQIHRAKVTFSTAPGKNGAERRMIKVEMPVAREVPSAATNTLGYTPEAAVAHIVSPYLVIPVDGLATGYDIADALKLLINAILGDAAAGTANAYTDATNAAREFLIDGYMPD